MTNLPQVFNYKGNEVRTVLLDNVPHWSAKDVCDVLGLKNVTETMKRLDDDEKSTLRISEGGPEVNVINESGLYSLIIRSSKPEAKEFKRWVTHEVLPAIRKTGNYGAVEKLDKPSYQQLELFYDSASEIAKQTAHENIELKEKLNEVQAKYIELLEEKVQSVRTRKPNIKVTAQIKNRIQELRNAGENNFSISRILDIPKSTVYHIVKEMEG